MKEEEQQQLHNLHHHRRVAMLSGTKFTRRTAYFLLVAISYALGYLSASSTTAKQQLSSSIKAPEEGIPPTRITTVATAAVASSLASEPDHFRFLTPCAAPLPSKLVLRTILDGVFNGTSPYESFPPPHISPLLRPKRIKGWGSTGAVFENLIRKVKPRTIIEVGTFLGASAIHMAEKARQLGLRTQILCIDDFRGWPGFRDRFRDIGMVNGDVMLLYQFMQNVVYANATESVLPIPFSTGSALEKLCEWGVFGDLIEVDAGHDFHSAWSDINRAYKLLRPGGVMFGHDYFTAADNRGVRRAVNLFARVKGFRVEVDGQHWVLDSA
ncbi:PREDICTED: uncharacterized protein LOC104593592 [Nelumbo nucifera]|uniref:Uncharacterized protein n=2 Tax=Nelumbo nucifera TaxID=4432 RepID=A0A822YZG1_NELNU|nr:PREDICTED: uncharacterized protein LOC104593592 [Nelumbo nucifera]DAD36136.1 TPA_asm: hypothetical protein HUJ06_006776 [Nelumbo nucifera]